jgi:ribosomal protein L35
MKKQSKKMKIKKSVSNRFEVTKTGKVLRMSSFNRHLRRKKSKKQLRRLKKIISSRSLQFIGNISLTCLF